MSEREARYRLSTAKFDVMYASLDARMGGAGKVAHIFEMDHPSPLKYASVPSLCGSNDFMVKDMRLHPGPRICKSCIRVWESR